MNNKIITSLLMILGTSVGAGMLALPIATAQQSLAVSITMLCFAWLLMTMGALAILEVNLHLPVGTNMISMADATLGKLGKLITWIIYLGLLYCLLCAYIAGTSDILGELLKSFSLILPHFCNTIIATTLLGLIVYQGIHSVAKVNQWLMFLKLSSYFILVLLLTKHWQLHFLVTDSSTFQAKNFSSTLMIMLTAYGFAIIIPSLRIYLNDQKSWLPKITFFGSLLPFLIYFIWILSIQSSIPRMGEQGLIAMTIHPEQTNSLLIEALTHLTNNIIIADLIKLFISICALTSFLGVSLSLTDCLADSLKLEKKGWQGLGVAALTFLPPLSIVLVKPGLFLLGLSQAGLFCIILLIGLPLLMLYQTRKQSTHTAILPGGNLVIFIGLALTLALCLMYFICR